MDAANKNLTPLHLAMREVVKDTQVESHEVGYLIAVAFEGDLKITAAEREKIRAFQEAVDETEFYTTMADGEDAGDQIVYANDDARQRLSDFVKLADAVGEKE